MSRGRCQICRDQTVGYTSESGGIMLRAYFSPACRDLDRAIDRFMYLKKNNL